VTVQLGWKPRSSTLGCASKRAGGTGEQGKPSGQHPGLPARERERFLIGPLLLHKRPTFLAAAVFVLTLSGPPRFRIRDPEASLRGDMDWVVILHLVVWGLAGFWVLWQIGKRFQAGHRLPRLRLPQVLALAMILLLAASAWVSESPALTTFKVYQMLVSMLLTQIFMEEFGVWTSLKTMLWGSVLLCLAVAACAVWLPDEVWTASEFNPDPSRLFGELIAQTGVVSVLAIMLLLTGLQKIWRALPLAVLALSITLLALSLMRTAYVIAFLFFTLVLLKRPNIKPLRRCAYGLVASVLLLYAWNRLPRVSQYRDPESVATLGDRIGLWRHLTTVTLNRSPWLGLGYYSASRIHGPEYNPGLGTAHSMFIEVLSGGGVLSFVALIALCAVLSTYAARLLYAKRDRFSFATASLFFACLLFGFTGEEIDSGPVAMGFWFCAAALPCLYEGTWKHVARTWRPSHELIGTRSGVRPPEAA
jgi:hypothetical protein